MDGSVVVGHQPGQRHLQRPGQPGTVQHVPGDAAVARRYPVEHQRLELALALRMLGQVVDRQRAAETLPQQHALGALHLRRLVEPGERRVDVAVDLRQSRLALRLAVAAIVEHQHLVALGGQPPRAAEVPGQVAAVAVQVEHSAFHRHAFLRRQPPGAQAHAVGGGQGDVAVLQPGARRSDLHHRLGIEQQRTAATEEQRAEYQQRDQQALHPLLVLTSSRARKVAS